MFEHKNLYPVILVPGVLGYGEDTLTHKVFPYFGLTSTSYEKVIKSMGMECHTPTFELLSSTWDRACELFAQLVGGTVDYGKAHSEKFGHARYGETYKTAMLPNWGQTDENGQLIKITLIAHGYGAPVARLLIDLLTNGCAEETAATAGEYVSPLFTGGYGHLVHCLVTIAGVNDGISLFEALEGRFTGAKKLLAKGAVAFDELKEYAGYVDPYTRNGGMKLSQHGVSATLEPVEGKKIGKLVFDEDAIAKYLWKEDNVFYDIGPIGMAKLNNKLHAHDNIYYLCIAGEVTTNILNKVTVPKLSAGITLPTAALISTFENYLPEAPVVTSNSHSNDGIVNTEAAFPPINEEATAFKSADRCNPGIWYQLPVENRNHFSFMGLLVRPDKYRNEIYDLMKIICNLETL